jgi:glutathione S-transferase
VKKILAAAAAVAVLLVGTACAERAASDNMGLWYAQGNSDGDHFDHCVPPGTSDDVSFNDSVYWVPNNLRTWNATPKGGDTNVPLTLTAKPDAGQTSGTQVLVWTQTSFKLNTYCGSNEKDSASPIVQWWQSIGRRYQADTTAGWSNMLLNTVEPALEKAKNTLRGYTADELVAGTVWDQAEPQFEKVFSDELTRLSGGNFFCGPSFTRAKPDCPQVAVSIKDVDYSDPGIQNARNDKQKAIEQAAAAVAAAQGAAAAAVAAAQGQVDAAAKQRELYNNPNWVALQKAQIQLEIAKACGANPNCHMIMGSDGTIITS